MNTCPAFVTSCWLGHRYDNGARGVNLHFLLAFVSWWFIHYSDLVAARALPRIYVGHYTAPYELCGCHCTKNSSTELDWWQNHSNKFKKAYPKADGNLGCWFDSQSSSYIWSQVQTHQHSCPACPVNDVGQHWHLQTSLGVFDLLPK
jgi:hypothetical protein